MFRFFKKALIALLSFKGPIAGKVNASYQTKCIPLSNQSYMTQFTIINLHSNEYIQELHYYPFTVNLDRLTGSFNTFNYLFNQICIPDKSENLNINVFNMITIKNESKTLTKCISCKYEYKFDGANCNSKPKWKKKMLMQV